MFSLQKLLGKEDEIFRLLEASAQEAKKSVEALGRVTESLDEPILIEEFARLRQIDKKITEEISAAAYTLFVTVLDREDIEDLSIALYKIPKMVDKFTERLLLSPPGVRKVNFSNQIGLLERSTDTVLEMVHSLRKEDLKLIQGLEQKLIGIENEADREMVELYRGLFTTQRDFLQTIALKDLYEQLEKVIDRCRDAGGVIAHIALKNS